MRDKLIFRIFGFLLIVGLIYLVVGCGNPTAQMEANYRKQWTTIMNKFESRGASDDLKANSLAKKNDIAGLYRFINERTDYVISVLTQVLKLDTPDKYRNVQVLTLFYLLTLEQRLKAQNDVNNAVLSGNPTGDLKKIADAYVSRSQEIGNELGVAINAVGLTLGNKPQPNSSAPKSSATNNTEKK